MHELLGKPQRSVLPVKFYDESEFKVLNSTHPTLELNWFFYLSDVLNHFIQ